MTGAYGRAVGIAALASAAMVILLGWTTRPVRAEAAPEPTRQERAERRSVERTQGHLSQTAAKLCAKLDAQLKGRGVAMTEAQANALAKSRRDVCSQTGTAR